MVSNIIVIMFLILSFVSPPLIAQFPDIKVNVAHSYNANEVTISINPTNPLNLAAAANLDYFYYSFDGGQSWTEGTLNSSLGIWGDPCVVFDAEGILHCGYLLN